MNRTNTTTPETDALETFHACTRLWFEEAFDAPTGIQKLAWPILTSGQNGLLLAPTGSGKTLAAFLSSIDRIMFGPPPAPNDRQVKVLYISPLKALGVDVDRNLKSPIAGLRAVAEREEIPYHEPSVGIRSGDTTQKERQEINRHPPEILITTPESLYLLLTSKAREILTDVETVIVDEIHAMVSTKRGSHLFLSLERLERLREKNADTEIAPLQRVGLSATQRPLEEIARALGGGVATTDAEQPPQPRPVHILDAGERKQFELKVEVPVEDMAKLAEPTPVPTGSASSGPTLPSIWPAIHPRLVELIKAHRSTMVFVNSRRLAERIAGAINEIAEEEIALAHHGSVAHDKRAQIEDRLKRGQLPAIIATSSLDLGIDMGAVDLVIQIESPPSIAAGVQRIGRSGHSIGEASSGVIFPKFRGDLLSCAAVTAAMGEGYVEETHYPRNPLDVLAQQIVAAVSLEDWSVDELFATIRGAAPFFELPRSSYEGVLDLLAGRYPSDEFSELRPRINWDRIQGVLSARRSSQRMAVLNAGTIPDRGLYGVFLVSEDQQSQSRVGELDEEMVFEMQPGDVFLLGASSWRVMDITRDKVLVVPAPGESGRMPFWRGDGPGRPLEFGRKIGELTRELLKQPKDQATRTLVREHHLDERAARNLVDYLHDQESATEEAPSDRTIVIEAFLDEIGDWRIAVLTPFGTRVHAPWAMAVNARLQEMMPGDIDMTWDDDGMLFRLPESEEPPEINIFLPASNAVEDEIVNQLSGTAMFAARFRENAARALLLPRRNPGKRTPLWLQRRKSADLLAVAARYPSFPILLETYRECLKNVFDMPGLISILRDIEQQKIRVTAVRSDKPSPFASSLLFSYTGNFLYNGDTPLAERRAQALALDHSQLRELLGSADFRELLNPEVVDQVEIQLQRLDGKLTLRDADDLHDLLLHLGALSREEIALRCDPEAALDIWLENLIASRNVIRIKQAGEDRYAAAEDAARLRDALGIVPPQGLPHAFLETVDRPLEDLVSRYARTHGPFSAAAVAERLGASSAKVNETLTELSERGRVLVGEFRPGGSGREWVDAEVLRTLKRRSLAQLRQQIEPVEQEKLQQFMIHWQSVSRPRRGLDGVLDVIEQLQGVPLPFSVWENQILPSRVKGFQTADLDELCAAGEILWQGIDPLGSNDGRICLYLADRFDLLRATPELIEDDIATSIRELLAERGAVFYDEILRAVGGFPQDVFNVLWEMVWSGEVTNDTLTPLRSIRRKSSQSLKRPHRSGRSSFRTRRRITEPGAEGRWSLVESKCFSHPTPTERQTALVSQLLERYGVLTREMVAGEKISGGFSALYPVLKAMEEAGRIRRGYFVDGLGAAQFATPGADDQLRNVKSGSSREAETTIIAATDPACLYGTALDWPTEEGERSPQRSAGSLVILRAGKLIGYLSKTRE
ncbi:MAG: DEAD/DEAH box helicase, partial [Planctomycetaceae bacterium]|nr:DEAD/DEAH box helicase [Planctomycetaceae bacterium]